MEVPFLDLFCIFFPPSLDLPPLLSTLMFLLSLFFSFYALQGATPTEDRSAGHQRYLLQSSCVLTPLFSVCPSSLLEPKSAYGRRRERPIFLQEPWPQRSPDVDTPFRFWSSDIQNKSLQETTSPLLRSSTSHPFPISIVFSFLD